MGDLSKVKVTLNLHWLIQIVMYVSLIVGAYYTIHGAIRELELLTEDMEERYSLILEDLDTRLDKIEVARTVALEKNQERLLDKLFKKNGK